MGAFFPLLIDSVENGGVRLVEARMFYVPIHSSITTFMIWNCLRHLVNTLIEYVFISDIWCLKTRMGRYCFALSNPKIHQNGDQNFSSHFIWNALYKECYVWPRLFIQYVQSVISTSLISTFLYLDKLKQRISLF